MFSWITFIYLFIYLLFIYFDNPYLKEYRLLVILDLSFESQAKNLSALCRVKMKIGQIPKDLSPSGNSGHILQYREENLSLEWHFLIGHEWNTPLGCLSPFIVTENYIHFQNCIKEFSFKWMLDLMTLIAYPWVPIHNLMNFTNSLLLSQEYRYSLKIEMWTKHNLCGTF